MFPHPNPSLPFALIQGIVYDLIAGQLDSFETARSLIIPNKGWNHILDQPGQMPEPWDAVVHLTYPRCGLSAHTGLLCCLLSIECVSTLYGCARALTS